MLPLASLALGEADEAERRWMTEAWEFRRGHALPGPGRLAGRATACRCRSLPHVPPEHYPYYQPQDPLEARGAAARTGVIPATRTRQRLAASTGVAVRTALAVEPRDGILYVFMPPVERVEDYLELLGQLEAAAAAARPAPAHRGLHAALRSAHRRHQGHPRSRRDRGQRPAGRRAGARPSTITSGLYEEARQIRLGAEKFMIDGRHTGTGGGNHVVLGGATPADSPFLRRPDLLKSLRALLAAPPVAVLPVLRPVHRPDQPGAAHRRGAARRALRARDRAGAGARARRAATSRAWLVDRLFRNLLVDVTGNTHRTEICIDKLYSPDGPTGRLGLLEFRAFEMPPDARMSLAQQLLLRALVAWFWREPQDGRLVRWGTGLHDRFMLPHFVWADFLGVLGDLRAAGYDFDPAGSRRSASSASRSTARSSTAASTLELRQALEPWHVMGEEGAIGGTVRYVDSSVERLQVKVDGFDPGRHVIACNGRRLPMTSTGVAGEAVAGVRFKAWKPASAACTRPFPSTRR